MILIYHISRATSSHYKAIRDLHGELFVGPKSDMPSLTQGYWWILKYNKEIVGFCSLKHSSWLQSTGYLSRVGVHPSHQGRGLQRKLIRVRESHARALSWTWVATDTTPNNYASSNSLISSGYKLFKPWYRWAWDKSSLYWLKKL